jgi:hypothetical protein
LRNNPAPHGGTPITAPAIFREVFVGEDADPSEMVLDCLQVEVRIMTAAKVFQICI